MRIIIRVLTLLVVFQYIFFQELKADNPCESFVVKVKYLTASNRLDSGYIHFQNYRNDNMVFNYIDEYYILNECIPHDKIDWTIVNGLDTTYFGKILAFNKAILVDTMITSDNEGVQLSELQIADSIHDFCFKDTLGYTYYFISSDDAEYRLDSIIDKQHHIMHYGNTKHVRLDTIKLLMLDSILWCSDTNPLQYVDAGQLDILNNKEPDSFLRLADSYSQQIELIFFSYDPVWTKSRILSLLDIEKTDNMFLEGLGSDYMDYFPSEIKEAINSKKILCFFKHSP